MLLLRSWFLFIFCVLQVIENGNPVDRKNWFPDIEPLFKLLSYENVPPYLKVEVYLDQAGSLSKFFSNACNFLFKY